MTLLFKCHLAWLQGMEPSVWGQDKLQPRYPRLGAGQEVQGDVVVIGAGLTGLSTAYNLAKAGGQGTPCNCSPSTYQAPAQTGLGRASAGLTGLSSAPRAWANAARQSNAWMSGTSTGQNRRAEHVQGLCASAQQMRWPEAGRQIIRGVHVPQHSTNLARSRDSICCRQPSLWPP